MAVGVLLALYQVSYFAAVRHVGVTVATLVALGLIPVFVSLCAPFVGDARIDVRTGLVVAIALGGLALLVAGAPGALPAGGDRVLGVVLAVVCAAGFASVNLLGRTLRDLAPLRLMTVAFVVGGAVLAAVLAAVLLGERLAPIGLLGGALVLVVVATVRRSPRSLGRISA